MRWLSMSLAFVLAIVLVLGFDRSCQTWAQEKPAEPAAAPQGTAAPAAEAKKDDQAKPSVAEGIVVTDHQMQLGGETIRYQATAGKLLQRSDDGKTKAEMFFVAYTRLDVAVANRPVTFCFNGGPGSSSVWLHLGMLGPKRIRFPDDASPLPPPYALEDNVDSLLDTTDLVFIDPVSTGYSRPGEGEEKGQFHGYDEDLRSVGQFIHDWTSEYQRWSSPKFLLGESYGGVRAAGLAGYLQDRYYMELNGIVIVSGVINFQTLSFGGSNDLPYIVFLPTYAATAWYHKALPADLQSLPLDQVVAQAEAFAVGPYASALLQGSLLEPAQQAEVAKRLAALTGLSESFVLRSRMRIDMDRFSKELLRERSRTVGRFDSRYLGIDRDNAGSSYEYDASGAAIFGPFTATFNDYVRSTLKYDDRRVYEILTGNVHPWSYRRFEGEYVDATDTLRQAMTGNPYLKVFLACGYYDLATPHFAMEHTMAHLGIDSSLQPNLRFGFYEGGHMMYIYQPSLQRLHADLAKFYSDAVIEKQ
jgi:carboxypeptidase C (cathepsin A)